jgi:hypothetical protein
MIKMKGKGRITPGKKSAKALGQDEDEKNGERSKTSRSTEKKY